MRRTIRLALAGLLTTVVHAEQSKATPVAPRAALESTQGAWSTGVYRNLFAERGHSAAEIDAKIDGAFHQLFFGDSATQSIYRVQADTSLALIESAGLTTSPDMGAAMLVAVMMDRPEVFQKLWKFAKNQMQNTIGDRQGYFAWQVETTPPYTPLDLNPSSNAEESIATALFLAARRWKGHAESAGYQVQADSILWYMTRNDRGERMHSLVDSARKQIVFAPAQTGSLFTDPAYHVPAFYRLWSAFATSNSGPWKEMADSSYALWKRAEHPVTGLFPVLSTFDGIPKLAKSYAQLDDTGELRYGDTTFDVEAYPVGGNIAVDWDWFRSDTWAVDHAKKQLGFFASQVGGYKSQYTLSGVALDTQASVGLIACNAAAALASNRGSDGSFAEALWNAPIASGDDRYTSGLVQMLSLLQVSGRFIAYGSPGLSVGIQEPSRAPKSFSIRQSGGLLQVEGVEGIVRLLDARGRETSRAKSTGSVTLAAPRPGLWIVEAGANGTRKVLVAP